MMLQMLMGDGVHPNHAGSPRNNCAVGIEHVDDIEGCLLFLMHHAL